MGQSESDTPLRQDPVMNYDYGSAASRHLRTARHLLSDNRWDNAGYLAGYAAECGVKAAIEKAGILLKQHVNEISSDKLVLAADLSLAARRFPLDLDSDWSHLQANWSTELRYSKTGTLDEADASQLVECANVVFENTVGAMVLDGFLDEIPK